MGAGVFAGIYGKAGQSCLLRHPGGSTGHFGANTAMCCAQRVGERPENLKGAARLPTGKPWGTGRSWRAVNQEAGKNGIDKFCRAAVRFAKNMQGVNKRSPVPPWCKA